ncbi:hypothetical protein V7985_004848 [Vibrio parahaemolyticus]
MNNSIAQQALDKILVGANDMKGLLKLTIDEQLTEIEVNELIAAIKGKLVSYGSRVTIPQLKAERIRLLEKERGIDGRFVENYVYLTSIGVFMNKYTKSRMDAKSFNMKYDRFTPANAKGNEQKADRFASMSIECFEDEVYAPAREDVFEMDGKLFYNSYSAPDLSLVEVGTSNVVEIVKNHISHLLSDPYEQELLLYYLAHNVQNTGILKRWAIILQGVQGDGKSFFAEMMRQVMGYSNVRVLNGSDLESSFSDWSEGQGMTFIEELRLDGIARYTVLNKIKPVITNRYLSVSIKCRSNKNAINTTNYMAFTNFRDAIPVDNGDRRWCVLFSKFQSRNELKQFTNDNPNYYSTLYESVQDNAGELRNWFLNIKIPDWFKNLNEAPVTNAKQEMIESTKPVELVALEEAIEAHRSNEINENIVNFTKLAWLSADDADFPNNRLAKNLMQQLGYVRISTRLTRSLDAGVVKKCYFYAKAGWKLDDVKNALENEPSSKMKLAA